ncbi:MAG TPA: hotdog domain-containing protein [Terriglobales bacterium]|nr:hotdog domain-containing protein [Terriglobales bacterium]
MESVLICLRKTSDASTLSRMPKTVPIGARGTAQERVHFDHTLTAHLHSLPPVYTTPDMVRLMETAGAHALQPFCEAGEISVGTAINIEHRAPVGVNTVVRAEATVTSVDGRFCTLDVKVSDGDKEIGVGTIRRTIVNTAKFLEKWKIPKP